MYNRVSRKIYDGYRDTIFEKKDEISNQRIGLNGSHRLVACALNDRFERIAKLGAGGVHRELGA